VKRFTRRGSLPLLLLLAAAAGVCYSSRAQAANVLKELKAEFNKDKGAPRLIVLVSPTCPACVGGAQWIEDEVLKQYPKLNIHVYAIWYEMYPGDSPKAFPSAKKTMPDARVEHYWDKKKATGRWFQANVPSDYKKPIMWDAYYLYDADAQWGIAPGSTPEPLVSHGRTILETRKELLKQVSLLSEKQDAKQDGSPQQ
jgi:hypothetical protein